MPIKKIRIIGIAGAFGSGKSTAADNFASRGFKIVSLSSFLEEEAKKRKKLPITRKILQDIGNEWREKFGKGILAEKVLDYLDKNNIDNAVVDGVRNIGEIAVFKESSDFVLLGIVADREKRFERLKKTKRREKLTWELFMELDYRDLGVDEKDTGLQAAVCLAVSDVFIENNTSKEDFENRLIKLTI